MTVSSTIPQITNPVLYKTSTHVFSLQWWLQCVYSSMVDSNSLRRDKSFKFGTVFVTIIFLNVDILFIFCMETFLLYALVCHCHNPFGCTDTDSTSSLPCWLECFIELCSVWALDLKCEASVHSKPTMSGVSCLPPRSLSPFISLFLPPSLPPSLPLSPSFSVVVMSHCSGKRTLIHWLDSSLPNSLSPRKNAQILPSSSRAHLFVIS